MKIIYVVKMTDGGFGAVWGTPPHYSVGYGMKMSYDTQAQVIAKICKISQKFGEDYTVVKIDKTVVKVPTVVVDQY